MPDTTEKNLLFEQVLQTIDAGKVLDVATGNGGFIQFVMDNTKSHGEIFGIDTSELGIRSAYKAFADKNVHFRHMDAANLGFADGIFDTVSIANSLHHMADLSDVLSEMVRVLKPGGTFLLAEMYRNNQTETQMTHVLLHHWWAAIDSAKGIPHLETFTRQHIIEVCKSLQLQQTSFFDVLDISSDPKDADLLKELETVIDRYVQKAEGTKDAMFLCKQGAALRSRIHEIGFHSATQLFMIGKK